MSIRSEPESEEATYICPKCNLLQFTACTSVHKTLCKMNFI